MQVTKLFHFSAGHQLPDEPQYGKCSRIHGHNYKVEVVLEGEVNSSGMVINFDAIKGVVTPLLAEFDHRFLCDLQQYRHYSALLGVEVGLYNFGAITTAENIARGIGEHLIAEGYGKMLHSVRVWETDTCSAVYYALV